MRRFASRLGVTTGIVIFAVVLAAGCSSGNRAALTAELAREVRQDNGAMLFRGGKVVVTEGVPVLTLSGTPYEMGLAYGVLLRDRLKEAVVEIDRCKDALIASRSPIERALAPLYLSMYTSRMAKRIPQEYLDEINGVADGSGVPVEKLLFAAEGAGIFSEPSPTSAPHCTSILARLPDRLIHGRNFDFYPALMGRYPIVVHYIPATGNAYWNFGVIGYLPAFHGINDKGVSITLNYGVASFDATAEGLSTTYKIRNILKNASTMAQVKSIVDSTPGDEPGWILTVESADEGKGTVFDVMGNVRAESEFSEPAYKMVFNREFSYVRYPDGKLAKKYLYVSDGEGEYNVARFTSGTKYLDTHPLVSTNDMLGFLRQSDFYGYQIPFNNNSSIVNDFTIHTLIFDWKNKNVLFSWGVAYSSLHPVVAFDLKTDTVSKFAPADPLLSTAPYASYVGMAVEAQIRYFSEDREWMAKHLDPATADPYALSYLVDYWEDGKKFYSFETLVEAADRLIKMYPDYTVPYSIKARLMKKSDPLSAIKLYNQALDAKINFVPDRIAELYRLAKIYADLDKKSEARATAQKCLALIDEMSKKYALDEWVVDMRKKAKRLAE